MRTWVRALASLAAVLWAVAGSPAAIPALGADLGQRSQVDPRGGSGPLAQAAIARLKDRGNTEIDRRKATLATLLGVVGDSRRLSETNRSALASEIQTDDSSLTSLRAKIGGDSDLATLRADVLDIVTVYRVYVLLEPKVHLVRAADALLS